MLLYFNSTIVQLIADENVVLTELHGFQFYYSSINSNDWVLCRDRGGEFQFYYSSINSSLWWIIDAGILYFNSTIVQLIEKNAQIFQLTHQYFNSTIVQLIDLFGGFFLFFLGYFNSTIVQLIAGTLALAYRDVVISILL